MTNIYIISDETLHGIIDEKGDLKLYMNDEKGNSYLVLHFEKEFLDHHSVNLEIKGSIILTRGAKIDP